MTEAEAKTKTCHRTMVPILNASGDLTYNSAACIGSACMAWRAVTEQQWFNEDDERVSEPVPGHAFRTGTSLPKPRAVVVGGYCGLAGAPR